MNRQNVWGRWVVSASVVMALAGGAFAAPYANPGPFTFAVPGKTPVGPAVHRGKEYSHFADTDFMGALDPEQVIAWDGLGGTADAVDYSGTRITFRDDGEVDAIANHGDALYGALRADRTPLAFTIGNGTAPIGSGVVFNAEGFPIGFAGDISYEEAGAPTKGVWAFGPPDINSMSPPMDVDGIEIWGPEPSFGPLIPAGGSDSTGYSLLGDAASGVSVWNSAFFGGGPYIPHGTIVGAVKALLGSTFADGTDVPDDIIDLDALMIGDRDGEPRQFGGPGDSIIFSIRQVGDTSDPDGFWATGSELFTLDAFAVGLFPGFLSHGGHIWDHLYSFAISDGASERQFDINGIEALAGDFGVPAPMAIWGGMALIGMCAARRRRRMV